MYTYLYDKQDVYSIFFILYLVVYFDCQLWRDAASHFVIENTTNDKIARGKFRN